MADLTVIAVSFVFYDMRNHANLLCRNVVNLPQARFEAFAAVLSHHWIRDSVFV